jgi:hypothetical protein
LKHHYWAGFTDYTSLFRFAIGYVFDKQSAGPCYCDLQMPSQKSKTTIDTPSTEAKGPICRVPLRNLHLSRLGLLSQSTSVSSKYSYKLSMHNRFMDSRIRQLASFHWWTSYHYDPSISEMKILSDFCFSRSIVGH